MGSSSSPPNGASQTPSLRIVVVNWNSGEQLRECVASVGAADRRGLDVEMVVVDNGSTDGSCLGLELEGVPLEVLRSTRNEGFARACNRGAAGASTTYLLFLNPDARLEESSLRAPVAFLESSVGQGHGAVGVQLVGDDREVHKSCARFPGGRHFLVRAIGLERALNGLLKGVELKEFDHKTSRDVDHVIGAFLLVRTAVFEALGGFDERFFLYLEDLDLSLRLARAGWRTRFLAEARAFHRGGGTSRQVRGRRQAYWSKARLRYASKHFKAPSRLLIAGTVFALEPALRVAAALARGRVDEIRACGEGYRLLLRSLLRGDDVFREPV